MICIGRGYTILHARVSGRGLEDVQDEIHSVPTVRRDKMTMIQKSEG